MTLQERDKQKAKTLKLEWNDKTYIGWESFVVDFKKDLLVYPDGIFEDYDLFLYAYINGYVEVVNPLTY